MNVAALDLGSNSFGLLVGRVLRDGRIDKVAARKDALRLGEVVALHGAIPEPVFERALGVVRDMVDVARAFDAEAIAAVGTSALRDAANGADFVRAVHERTGVAAEILSGDDEAKLVYKGARSALEDLPERALVIDLGGGSVELAMGDGNDCLALESLPLGFLRVMRELTLGAVCTGTDITRLTAHVRALGEGPLRRLVAFNPRAFVLSGGTARALGRVAAALGVREVSAVGLRRLAAHLARRDPTHLRVLGVEAARASCFGVGLVVLATLVEAARESARAEPSILITSAGLREGVVLREAKRSRLGANRGPMRTRAA